MAKLISMRAEYGTSVELKGTWHKVSCAAEVAMEPGDDSAKVKTMAWNTVIVEVEKQVKEILASVNTSK